MGDTGASWLSCRPPQVKGTSPPTRRATAIFCASCVSPPSLRTTAATNSPTREPGRAPRSLCQRCSRLEAELLLRRGDETGHPVRPRRSLDARSSEKRSTASASKWNPRSGSALKRGRAATVTGAVARGQVGSPAGADGASPSKATPIASDNATLPKDPGICRGSAVESRSLTRASGLLTAAQTHTAPQCGKRAGKPDEN